MHSCHEICPVVTSGDQLAKLKGMLDQINLFELRIDLYQPNPEDVPWNKCLLTLRSRKHGGIFEGSNEVYQQTIESYLRFNPAFVDVEADRSKEWMGKINSWYPAVKIVQSHHELSYTPDHFDCLLTVHPAVSVYKVVTFANSTLDALRLLEFVQGAKQPIVGFCMGEEGRFSRLISPILGSRWSYASLEEAPSSLGMYSYEQLTKHYSVQNFSKKTRILGLIGDPVNKSPSLHTHQPLLREIGIDALYVQMRVEKNQLNACLEKAASLGFYGLSVTMPLKEQVAEAINSSFHALNTLKFTPKGLEGTNTDGLGAMAALGYPKEKRLMILGAGGAAYGIAFEALKQGNKVTITNRTESRAKHLAELLGCQWKTFGNTFDDYDILINTVPAELDYSFMWQNKLCLEAVAFEDETPFMKAAKKRHCKVVPGLKMFIEQAKKQFSWWFR